MKYEVLVNGDKVWEGDGPDEFDRNTFPAEHRERPAKGSTDEVTLITDGEVIAVNRAEDAATPDAEIVGSGGGTADNAVGQGG